MLLDRFVEICREKAPELARRLATQPQTELEDRWATATRARWYPLPAPQRLRSRLYAGDGSGHTISLNNGLHVVVAQAFLAGPAADEVQDAVDLDIVEPRRNRSDPSDVRDLMMRRLEARVALDAAEGMSHPQESILFLDGSLHTEFTHLAPFYGRGVTFGISQDGSRSGELQPGRVEGTLESYVQLLQLASSQDLLVVGVAKTIQAHFLTRRLEQDGLAPGDDPPSDPQLLYRWAPTAGYSHPVLLGTEGLPYIDGPAQELLADCPAVVSWYVRPTDHDDPMRIDVPASAVGLGGSVGETDQEWVDEPTCVKPIVSLIRAMYGGRSVHNAPLYAVDRKVRLSRRTVEQVYLPVLSRMANVQLAADRSRRRFAAW